MIAALLPDTITLTPYDVLALGTGIVLAVIIIGSLCFERGEARMLKRMKGDR